jgi:1-phosphofructokinase family hexose kinase
MTGAFGGPAVRRVVGVALNAAVDRVVSVDRLVPGEIHRPVVRSVVAGGKAANVVRAARHLGLDGTVVAVLGGHAGAWYRDDLAERGIPLHEIAVGGETRLCLSVLDESTGSLTEFYEPGLTLGPEAWPDVEAALRDALATDGRGTVVALAGSLPPGAPVDAYARLASIAAAAGARTAIDIDGEPLLAALGARPWLVKVNAREAATVTGGTVVLSGDGNAAEAAEALRARGASIAIVTRGVDGAAVATVDGSWALGALPSELLGPFAVGSGDAFLAGFLAGLSRGATADGALRVAGAAGAANARRPGQGELDASDLERTAGSLDVSAIGR